MRYLGRLLFVGAAVVGVVGCSAQNTSTDAQPNISPADEVYNEPSPTSDESSVNDSAIAPSKETSDRDSIRDNRDLCIGTMEQINGFGDLLEDVELDYAQLQIGTGLVDLAAGIEELVEKYPNAEAVDESSAFATYFRGYGEEMEAAIGDRGEYVAVMERMMDETDLSELREDFLAACGAK